MDHTYARVAAWRYLFVRHGRYQFEELGMSAGVGGVPRWMIFLAVVLGFNALSYFLDWGWILY